MNPMAKKEPAYLAWKHWDPASFGSFSARDHAYFSAEIARASASLPECPRVLEIGFGNGSFLAWARQRGWSIEGTELIPDLINQARVNAFPVYAASELAELPRQGYDLVVAFDVLEHISSCNLEGTMNVIYSLLRPGGCLVARFPNADSPFGLEGQHGDPTHMNAIGVGKIKYYAAHIGFSLVYLGPEAQPVPAGGWGLTARRLVTLPIKVIVDLIVGWVFLPGSGVSFSSRNTVAVLRKTALN